MFGGIVVLEVVSMMILLVGCAVGVCFYGVGVLSMVVWCCYIPCHNMVHILNPRSILLLVLE